MSETDADALARRVAFAMLANEGTGKAWGIQIERRAKAILASG